MCTPQLVQTTVTNLFTFKDTSMKDNTKLMLWFGFIVLLAVAGPLCTVWALNTLFPVLAIPYTFDTWVATVLLFGIANSGFSIRK